MSKKPTKSESLTIRLDPKSRFMLEFISKLRGQTITTVVERAIYEAADRAVITREYGFDEDWQAFWSVYEGVRNLAMAKERALFPTYEDEKRLEFAREHWPFFYHSADRKTPRVNYIDILWPDIDRFVAFHDENKRIAYFEAGALMQKALRSADLEPPAWPVARASTAPTKAIAAPPASRSDDLDDEIPF